LAGHQKSHQLEQLKVHRTLKCTQAGHKKEKFKFAKIVTNSKVKILAGYETESFPFLKSMRGLNMNKVPYMHVWKYYNKTP
jgi:hypothetical protein